MASSSQRDGHLAAHPVRREGILHDVGGGIGRGERHGDDEIGGGEAEQDEDEGFAAPLRKEPLQHADAALAVGTGFGDAGVDRQGAEQGDQNQNQRGQRGEQAGGQKGDAGLVAERREVVDAGEAHHAPPGVFRLRRCRARLWEAGDRPAASRRSSHVRCSTNGPHMNERALPKAANPG